MRLLLYSDKPLNEAPRSTWQPYKYKGRGTVAIRCPVCSGTMCVPNRTIDSGGAISGPVTCPWVKKGLCTMKKAALVLCGWSEFWSSKPN
jgi:hypothetical protein